MWIPFVPMFPLFTRHAPILAETFSKHAPPHLGNEPTALHLSVIFPCVLDMTNEWGPPELCSPGLEIKAAPTSKQSISQFTLRASDQPINQSVSQQMLPSLREGAGSGMVELVTPTKASSFWKESDFSCFVPGFKALFADLVGFGRCSWLRSGCLLFFSTQTLLFNVPLNSQ